MEYLTDFTTQGRIANLGDVLQSSRLSGEPICLKGTILKTLIFLLLLPVLGLADTSPYAGGYVPPDIDGYYNASDWIQAVHQFEPKAVIAAINSGPGTPTMSVTYYNNDQVSGSANFTRPVSVQNDSFSTTLQSSDAGYSDLLVNFDGPIVAFGANVAVKTLTGTSLFALAGYQLPGLGYQGTFRPDGSFDGFFGFLYSNDSTGFYINGMGGVNRNATMSASVDEVLVAYVPSTVSTPEPGVWGSTLVGMLAIGVWRCRRRTRLCALPV